MQSQRARPDSGPLFLAQQQQENIPRCHVPGVLPWVPGATRKPQEPETDCPGDLMLPRSRISAAAQLGSVCGSADGGQGRKSRAHQNQ